jgi:16S rRNA U1498 N3-methylase RsmE
MVLNLLQRFSLDEAKRAIDCGAVSVGLGNRILRTETAAITSVSMCMLYAEMNLSE